MRKVLPKKFFERPSLEVAEDLLGKFLVRKYRGREISSMIVETEAYEGAEDLASHARHGKTPRNTPMFDEAGLTYIYLVYGMYYLLNVTTCKKGEPGAVLIRGTEEAIGPGKLTKKLRIDKRLNHKKLGKDLGLWIEDRGIQVSKKEIRKMPRVGIDYAGAWAKKPYRFVLKQIER